MCSGWIGIGNIKIIVVRIATISTMLHANKKEMYFLIFSKMIRPSRTASTIVPKASSVKIMSEASLATSVPRIPIATPISAPFKAGASLTPSPVIATTSPSSWKARTICNLFSGDTRANTATSRILSIKSLSSWIASNSLPVMVFSWFSIPISRAITDAVLGWSPVIIFTWIPAACVWAIASFTSWRGGSMIPNNPSMVSLSVLLSNQASMSSATLSASPWSLRVYEAKAITRLPSAVRSSFFSCQKSSSPFSVATKSRTTSIAPFTIRRWVLFGNW